MNALVSSPVIAMDGGGTRCRLALETPQARHVITRGSANVASDFHSAITEMQAGLAELAQAGGLTEAQVLTVPAYLGLAGVTDDSVGERVAKALGLTRARVRDDRGIALRGALGLRDGGIAHFGTGSFFALQTGGQMRFAGGWGSRLGDEGSAFWIARAALTATLNVADGLAEDTPLTRAVLARFGSTTGIVRFATEAAAVQVAELAPMVTQAAPEDTTAARILHASANHAERMLTAMGWQPGMALCLTGGLGPEYRPYLSPAMQAAICAPEAPPIKGALALARDFASEVPT